jgi:class 3 adenylate cyclase
VHGDAVNLAARLEAMNKEYGTRLLMSETSISHLPEDELEAIGEITARGQSRSIKIYTLASLAGERNPG